MEDNNEKDVLMKKVQDIKQKYEERAKLREKNKEDDIDDKREDFESQRRKLKKTDVKKMTTYKNKIKTINDDVMPAILQDLNEVNMGFYVDEIATTVVSVFKEAKIKSAELKDLITFITEMNIRYENFLSIIQDQIQDMYTAEKDIKKRKLFLRVICEMSLCGLFPISTTVSILKSILPGRNKGENQTMVVLLLDVIKMYGCEFFGFLPHNVREFDPELINTLRKDFQPIQENIVEKFISSITNYYNKVVEKYVKVSHSLSRKEAYLNKIKILRGEIPSEMEEEYNSLQNEYNGYKEIVTTISDYVGLELPKIEEENEEENEENENENESVVTVIDSSRIDYEKTPFQDEQTYSFYKNLPNLREAVPASLLGTIIIENKTGEKKTLTPLVKQENKGTLDDAIKQLDSFESSPSKSTNNTSKQQQQQQQSSHTKTIIKSDVDVEIDTNKQTITELFSKLTELRTTKEVDKWAIQFCYINSKTTRAKLIEELLNCPVNQYTLLVPLYCRLAASLKIVVKDIGLLLSNPLTKKLAGMLLNTLDQNRYDLKSYYITYLGELTKFELSPPGNALYIAKILLKKPTIIRLEYLTSLMENCGLFLMFISEIESETNKYLNTLMNIKSKLSHDVRLSNMLMNVYYICRPSERPPPVVITIPTPLLYMKYLLLEKLDKDTVTDIVNEILNYDLDNTEVSDFFIKTVLSTYNYKYNSIECLAQVLDELYVYKPMLILRFRDALLETIYLDLEENSYTKNQQRVCQIKLLGECFNYQIIEFDQLMEILYLLIHFSHRITEDNKEYLITTTFTPIVPYHPMITSLIDPPEDAFRVVLVCEILTTIQEYIKHADYSEIFNIYSLYCQRYILSKKLITIDIQWQLNDSFYTYFPEINKYDSMDKIELALSNIENTTSDIIEKTKMYGLLNLPEYDLKISGNKENIIHKVAKGKSKKNEISAEEVENQKILSQLDQEYQKMMESSKSHVGSVPTAQSVDNMIIPIEIQSKVQKSNGCFLLLRRKDGKVETKEMEINDSDKAALIRKEKREQREKEQADLKAKIVAYQRTLEERAEHPDFSDEEM